MFEEIIYIQAAFVKQKRGVETPLQPKLTAYEKKNYCKIARFIGARDILVLFPNAMVNSLYFNWTASMHSTIIFMYKSF